MSEKDYEKQLRILQIELLKLQYHIKQSGLKVLIILEGRDASGKGGTIKRITQNLNPRGCRIVALPKPSDVEAGQWYLQRYVGHLPSKGEIAIFDRSWYNRAMVEPVMGFCTEQEYEIFIEDVVKFEEMLLKSGIYIFKFFLSITKETQKHRFKKRYENPLKRFKISEIDKKAQELWEQYDKFQIKMLEKTSTKKSPWIVVDANSKKKTHINVIKFILSNLKYPNKISDEELKPSTKIIIKPEDEIKRIQECSFNDVANCG